MRCAWSALILLAFTSACPGADPARIDYVREVKPLLQQRCWACHGALRQKGGLRLDTLALMRQGGDNGPAVIPHKADDSRLLAAVTGQGVRRMPPKNEAPPLADKEIA